MGGPLFACALRVRLFAYAYGNRGDRVEGAVENAGMPDTIEGSRTLKRLERAARTGALVRVRRSVDGGERLEGFVVAATGGWTLLARCVDLGLDGWTAVRTADVVKVRQRGDESSLAVRALGARGQWPVRVPEWPVQLDGLPELLAVVGEVFGLVSLHLERQVAQACWIGAVAELRAKSLRLHEVDPEARWHAVPTKFRYRDITRVDFGGRYEETLREFAGPRA